MTDQLKNILIGLFVVGALTILVSMIFFLEPTVGDGKKILKVRFANISGITIGTRVTFAGKPVGEVLHINEVADARSEPGDETGRVYIYQLTLKVDSSVSIYNTDEVAIRTTGLMGEKSIAIIPRMAAKGAPPPSLVTGHILYASSVDPLENTFNQVSKAAGRVEGAIRRFDRWFDENQERLTQALASFGGAMGQADAVLAAVGSEKIVPLLRESALLFNENLDAVRTSLKDDLLLHKVANLTESLDTAAESFNRDGSAILRNIHQVSRDLSSGTGTLGRLIGADDLYLRVTSLTNKAETLFNDINHYGLLFQYDKHWQRGRTKKANLLKALDTPKEFRAYFEGEIDTITTSLGRLSELIDKAEGPDARENIVQSEAFKKDFASLLRQVQGLSDTIKLYNQELVAQSGGLSTGPIE